ncbi:MAG: hypothetical protein MJ137_07820, partial [Clostridia bacterium]|nr:hypothetical protein [Clostridia bacterium]
AIAVYGESHWYWEKDEAAFLGGPADVGLMTKSCTSNRSGVEYPNIEYYTSSYKQTVTFNVLVNEETKKLLGSSDGSETLKSFSELCREIRESTKTEEPENQKEESGSVLPYLIPATAVLLVLTAIACTVIVKKKKAHK